MAISPLFFCLAQPKTHVNVRNEILVGLKISEKERYGFGRRIYPRWRTIKPNGYRQIAAEVGRAQLHRADCRNTLNVCQFGETGRPRHGTLRSRKETRFV